MCGIIYSQEIYVMLQGGNISEIFNFEADINSRQRSMPPRVVVKLFNNLKPRPSSLLGAWRAQAARRQRILIERIVILRNELKPITRPA